MQIDIIKNLQSKSQIKEALFARLENYANVFPEARDTRIILKPNLNANMSALTGNTTDLRLIACVLEYLKDKGYTDIAIAEGTNSGYYRNRISVISRLGVDRLANHYGVSIIDCNYSQSVPIDFENGVRAGVAREIYDCECLINMPKLKTHFEAGMSVCLKNLMGTLVGQANKKKTHNSLAKNILNINKFVKPHLQIVDGLIAMEGLGPTRGTPVNTGLVILGTDPFLVDLACAKIAKFDIRKITPLAAWQNAGGFTDEYVQFYENLDVDDIARKFAEPKANSLVHFIHSPKRQKYFLAVRNTRFFKWLCSTDIFGYLLFKSGLRQDNFIKQEIRHNGYQLDRGRCVHQDGCQRCRDYCPVDICLPEDIEAEKTSCIKCLYCYSVCPEKAVIFKGSLGFMSEQIRQYDGKIRNVCSE